MSTTKAESPNVSKTLADLSKVMERPAWSGAKPSTSLPADKDQPPPHPVGGDCQQNLSC